ncbi:LPS export ABC transporter permease LptF [Marinobacteraceae bacterium S3BR75-40.1]
MYIIFRYLTRQVLVGMLAVTGVLLLVFMSGRFIKYLGQAASGELSGDVLFAIMAYRLPDFLELILPLGLFIGILLAYGRMYLDSEMAVLFACGVSDRQIIGQTMIASLFVTAIVAVMSLYLSPWGMRQVQQIFVEQSKKTEFEMLAPGRFQSLESGDRVTYTESLSEDKQELRKVFIAQPDKGGMVLLSARSGTQFVDQETGSRFLVLHDGTRFSGIPGQLDFKATTFNAYGLKIGEVEGGRVKRFEDATPTAELIASDDLKERAQFHWRLALPLIVPVVTLLAIRLSRVNPRQGRFFHLLPAMLIYITYLGMLIGARDALAKGKIPEWMGLWWVHLLFLIIALLLQFGPDLKRRRSAHA